MRWRREEYLELMTFGRVERQMFVELFGPLVGLPEEWRAQGASEDEIAMLAFDWDYVERCGCGGHCGPITGLEPTVISESADELIQRDSFGRTVRLCKATATIPLPMDWPVQTMDDWRRRRHWYEFRPERIVPERIEEARQLQQQGYLVCASIPGAFDTPRTLMGDAAACMACYDDPELLHDILATCADTAMRVLGAISEELVIDRLFVHEDLAGKSGPLVGPAQVEEFFRPYFRPLWDLLASRGCRIFEMDSDGNVDGVIDSFLDCGLTCIYPMEPAAGMDVVALRRKYGRRLAMRGGIDKHVLRQDRDAIRRELEDKMQPLMQAGGMVFGLDHRIPNGTPIENYRYYVDLGRELLGLPPRDPAARGWQRMA